MKVSKYGIVLRRLKQEDIELVREWRNSPAINRFMEYREVITPEMQEKWFESVNNLNNFYFIIEFEGKPIGLINSSKIEWDTVSSEGGIFLWDEAYYETMVPVWASLCLLETTYHVLGAGNSYIKTLKDNERAKKLNSSLGYLLTEGQEDAYNQQYRMTPESFQKHSPKLIRAASLLAGRDNLVHTMEFDREDIESGLADFFREKIRKEMVLDYRKVAEGRQYIFKPITV